MRAFSLAIPGGALLWLLTGAPVPVFQQTPMAPSAETPTFRQAVQWQRALVEAAAKGELSEDSDRRALRRGVLDAVAALRRQPCNPGLRSKLSRAVVAFLDHAPLRAAETIQFQGRTLNATKFFNAPVYAAISMAFAEAWLARSDLPLRHARSGIVVHGLYVEGHQKPACKQES